MPLLLLCILLLLPSAAFAQVEEQVTTVIEATVVDAPRNLTLTMKSNTQKVDAREFMPLLEQMKGVSNVKPVAR